MLSKAQSPIFDVYSWTRWLPAPMAAEIVFIWFKMHTMNSNNPGFVPAKTHKNWSWAHYITCHMLILLSVNCSVNDLWRKICISIKSKCPTSVDDMQRKIDILEKTKQTLTCWWFLISVKKDHVMVVQIICEERCIY